MTLPDQLILERFRCFPTWVTLPLSPITLVYGSNNSGKSALLRSLALLGASLEPNGTTAIRLPEQAFPGCRFQDLAWQGDYGSYAWKLGVRWSQSEISEALFTLNGATDTPPFIARLDLRSPGSVPPWRAMADEDRRLIDPRAGTPLPFDGLIPATDALDDLRSQLLPLRGKVRWLAGVRQKVPRVIEAPTQAIPSMVGDGEGSAHAVAFDSDLREDVASFYENLDSPRRLEVHESPPLGRWLSLNPKSQPLWRVHINDTGEGMAQVLPVLTQAALTAREGGLLAVEEPESHLYPSAQRTLARHICSLSMRNSSPRYILETHSRVFLLAVQLEVANGYPADNVRIVWVDQLPSGRSSTTVLKLRDDGHLSDGWPPSALGEDLALARELSRLGRRREEGR
jgi:hypothetical protein